MKVTIELPRSSQARAVFDEEQGLITLEPRFRLSSGKQAIIYLCSEGKSGSARRFIIELSGKDGRITIVEAQEVETMFDLPEAEREAAPVLPPEKEESESA
jgi:hypothetical protein